MRIRPMKMAAVLLALSCSGNGGPGEPAIITPPNVKLALQPIVTAGLSSPVHLASPPNDDRLFVVEQAGRIRVVQGGALLATPFLDITGKVESSGNEQGLLSVAFHPSYGSNRFFFVFYTLPDKSLRIERYTALASNANLADPASAKSILTIPHPFTNHNGGLAVFGPDNFLYLGTGDGGSANDPQDNGQNRNSLLGKLLRIDVNSGDPYGIPPGNPFVGQAGARPEIWAYGLRNPWRFSFDRAGNTLYIGDVGQGSKEEVNAASRTLPGLNYGWKIMEGSSCFGTVFSCDRSNLTLPVHEYDTGSEGTCAVTGGFVYRGSAIPEIQGLYFFSDFCSGGLRSFRLVNGAATDVRRWDAGVGPLIASFGEDRNGELYVIARSGTIGKLIKAP